MQLWHFWLERHPASDAVGLDGTTGGMGALDEGDPIARPGSLPAGKASTYGQVAAAIGEPRASRAVGSAVGSNPVAFLIPCHRVIKSAGIIGDYRWGPARKKALLAWESAQAAS